MNTETEIFRGYGKIGEIAAQTAVECRFGQEVETKVVDFNGEDRKISLSIKALQNETMRAEEADSADVQEDDVQAETAAAQEEE